MHALKDWNKYSLVLDIIVYQLTLASVISSVLFCWNVCYSVKFVMFILTLKRSSNYNDCNYLYVYTCIHVCIFVYQLKFGIIYYVVRCFIINIECNWLVNLLLFMHINDKLYNWFMLCLRVNSRYIFYIVYLIVSIIIFSCFNRFIFL